MQTLAIVATKGGVGKTTLVASLAIEATHHFGRVALIDLDPQQSLARWHQFRVMDTGVANKPELIATGAKLGSALDRVRAKAQPPDLVIIDGPPGSMRLTEMAIERADLALIPCKASPIDVEAVDVVRELCEQHGKLFAMVLTMVTPRRGSMTEGEREFLQDKGDVLEVDMTDRQSYAQAMMTSHAGPEKDKTAKGEIAALWVAIAKRLAAATRVVPSNKVAAR